MAAVAPAQPHVPKLELLHPLLKALSLLLPFWWLGLILVLIGAWRVGESVLASRRIARSGIEEIDSMGGTDFERRMHILFRDLGYRVEHTGRCGDYGADLVIARDADCERIVVQAKRWTKPVGVRAVQEVVAAKPMYRCASAMVVTNSRFTDQARALARANNVELWDRERLVAALVEARGPGAVAANVTASP